MALREEWSDGRRWAKMRIANATVLDFEREASGARIKEQGDQHKGLPKAFNPDGPRWPLCRGFSAANVSMSALPSASSSLYRFIQCVVYMPITFASAFQAKASKPGLNCAVPCDRLPA